jgi:hypothetical protein
MQNKNGSDGKKHNNDAARVQLRPAHDHTTSVNHALVRCIEREELFRSSGYLDHFLNPQSANSTNAFVGLSLGLPFVLRLGVNDIFRLGCEYLGGGQWKAYRCAGTAHCCLSSTCKSADAKQTFNTHILSSTMPPR